MLSITKVTNAFPILEMRIEETTAGLPSSFAKHLCSTGEDNATTIVEYITAVENEVNLSDNYRKDLQLGGGRDKLLDTQNSNYLIVIEL